MVNDVSWLEYCVTEIFASSIPRRSATSFASAGWLLPVSSFIEFVAIARGLFVVGAWFRWASFFLRPFGPFGAGQENCLAGGMQRGVRSPPPRTGPGAQGLRGDCAVANTSTVSPCFVSRALGAAGGLGGRSVTKRSWR